MIFSKKTLLIVLLPILAIGFLIFSAVKNRIDGVNLTSELDISSSNDHPELKDVKNYSSSFNSLRDFFQGLAEKKGGEYAFAVMKVADIPPNIDMHLMGHAIGDILYKQKGLEGIKICTDDFRNACSHSIVVGLFSDNGNKALPEIAQACRAAPGGSGAYTMCFHGLGHGILAAIGYDLEKTVEYCSDLGTAQYGFQEKSQCISGSIMEIIGGGGHDHEIWERQRKKYLNTADPLYPCNNDLVPVDSKYLCYDYLTPFLLEAVDADLGNPGPGDFEKAFKFCDKISERESSNRDACFGGFGKEFVGLIQGRDIRKSSIASITDDKFRTIYSWCKLANNKNGTAACILHATDSLFWGGENDVSIALKFCGLINDPFYQGSCYRHLIGAVNFFIKDRKYIEDFCSKLPVEHRDFCLNVK